MDQATLVEMQIDDGKRLVSMLADRGFDVTAAFWAKPSEEGLWFLYIASKVVDDEGLPAAYRRLNTAVRSMPELWVSPFDIKLISVGNPIASDVKTVLSRSSATIPIRYHGARLGGVSIDEAYLYPPTPSHA
jgi:hypothetical protein